MCAATASRRLFTVSENFSLPPWALSWKVVSPVALVSTGGTSRLPSIKAIKSVDTSGAAPIPTTRAMLDMVRKAPNIQAGE